MGAKRGYECVLNYKEGGISGVGEWTELTNAMDVSSSGDVDKWEMTTRAAAKSGFKAFLTLLKEAPLTFKMLWDTADAGFAVLREAWFGNLVVGFQILDGADGQGIQADFNIAKFTRNEPLNEGVTVDVEAFITYVDTAPEWIGAT